MEQLRKHIFKMKFLPIISTALFSTALSLTCEQGKVPDTNNMCIKPRYIEGCTQYASSQTCGVCQYNYKIEVNGLCEYNPNQSGDCCLKRDQYNRCQLCNSGMFLNDNFECQHIKIMGCLQKSSRGKCINCASGFVLTSDGNCAKGIKDCTNYLDNSHQVCIECTPDHSLVNNACLINTILGCKKEVNHSCKECYQPFTEKDGHCEIKECKSYNDFGCTACHCGFYITETRTCQEMIPGCLRYQRGSCTDCLPNFKLKGNTCAMDGCQKPQGSKCGKCKQLYELKDGYCAIANCLDWENDICKICANGFFNQKGACVQQQQIYSIMPVSAQLRTGL